ncbi:cytochrome c oxidase assembly protein [Marinobacteraceae bacterium S3BR75-40.1]
MQDFWEFLTPYDVSPLSLLAYLAAVLVYGLGVWRLPREQRPGTWRQLAFWLGLGLCYAVMNTRLDYYAQYMFFVHRGQHLILHHLGPFLIALSNPLPVLAAMGVGRPGPRRFPRSLLYGVYRVLQHPLVAPVLFVGLIFFWLWPSVHFDAMLSRDLYWLMNWSMLLDGLLFWWLILDPRDASHPGTLRPGVRILMLLAVVPPQIALGAYITLSDGVLYDVYAVCGRAWPMAAETDQHLGGLLTWIPAAMMSVIGVLVLLPRLMRQDRQRAAAPWTGEGETP